MYIHLKNIFQKKFLFCSILFSLGTAQFAFATIYNVSNGTEQTINRFAVCKVVDKAVAAGTGAGIMVPTGTAAEWLSFRTAFPDNTTINGTTVCPCVTGACGSDNCPVANLTCDIDYRKNASTCTACVTGEYKAGCSTATACSACTNKPANTCAATYSGTGGGSNNCPVSSVTCSTDYQRATATTCTACGSGTYTANCNTLSSCTSCTNGPAGNCGVTYSGTGSGTNSCPISSVNCTVDYYKSGASNCLACSTGQYKAGCGTGTSCSTCTNGPAGNCSVTYSGTGGGSNSCPISAVSCTTDYYRSGTNCVSCSNGQYKSSCNTGTSCSTCTNGPAGNCGVTYSGTGSGSNNCPISTVSCTTDYYKSGTNCVACSNGQYKASCNTGTSCSSCTNKPANSCAATYSGSGSGTNNCPISSVTCNTDYYRPTSTTCGACATGTYATSCNTAGSCTACTNKPSNSTYSGTGGGSNNCSWTCNSGYTQSGGTCVPDGGNWVLLSTESCADFGGCTSGSMNTCGATPTAGAACTPLRTCRSWTSGPNFKEWDCQ